MSFLKKIIPASLKENVKQQFVRLAEQMSGTADKMRYRPLVCSVCGSNVHRFLPFLGFESAMENRTAISIFTYETFNFLNYHCPVCKANDRDRLYALFLKQQFAKLDKSKRYRFIDFAPETVSLAQFVRSFPFLDYRSADLFMEGVDDKVDLQDMKVYDDNSADFYICSHILEHVDDDRKAMRELYRILKPGGWGIVMAPIQLGREEVYEDFSITNPKDRWTHFGQNDHVRVYSREGYLSRLREAGLTVNEYGKEYFGADKFDIHGIYPRSVLYVVSK